MAVSLLTRKNIKEAESERNAAIAKVKENLGLDELTLDIDWEPIDQQAEASGRKNMAGELINWYLNPLVSNTESYKADEMYAEALQEVIGKTAVIKFELCDEDPGKYVATKLESGVITFRIQKEKLAANVDEIFKDVEEQL